MWRVFCAWGVSLGLNFKAYLLRGDVPLPGIFDRPKYSGRTSIGKLLFVVFLVGSIVTSIRVYSAFIDYRVGAVRDMAQADERARRADCGNRAPRYVIAPGFAGRAGLGDFSGFALTG